MNTTEIKPCEGIVYKWTNKVSKKWYIGSHKGTPEDGYTASGKAIRDAFKKYGIGSFGREVLYQGLYFREAEEFILEVLNAALDRNSYNMKNAAIGGDVWEGRKDTPEYQEHLLKLSQPGARNGMYRRIHTEESRELMRKSKIGGTPWNKGKTGIYSEEVTKRRTESRKGFKHSTQTKESMSKNRIGSLNSNAKKVCIDGTTYITKQEACIALGISLYKLNIILKVYQDFRD